MASRFPPAWMDELRARSDIVQTVSGYVSLKKNGKKYWGLCPFHGEKTASFSVDPEMQLYYCFGCKAGGTVFTFIMEMERLTFPEAVELLAERAHMPMPQMIQDEDYERRRSQRERLLSANREAARFFHETLFTPAGAAALDYLKRRGLSDGVIRKFGLGAAPDSWDALLNHLTGKGYTQEELRLVNLIAVKEAVPASEGQPARPRRAYDIFRNRAMFPVIDQYGNVLAFSGRILDPKGERKYLNTSDTPVFNKGKNIFGANLLRKERHLDRVILVEGNMDVVSLTQFGIRGVCATLGTAFTLDQARLIKRFAPMVCLAYDGDAAGQHAILRGLDILKEAGVPVRVLDFPQGMDPDDFIRKEGAEGFAALQSISPETYRIRRLKDSLDVSTREGRTELARKAMEIIAPLDPVERDGHLKDLVLQTGFSREILDQQLAAELKRRGDSVPEPGPWARRPKKAEDGQAMGVVPTGETDRKTEGGRKRLSDEEWKILKAQEVLLGLAATGLLPEDLSQEEDFDDPELKYIYQDLKKGVSVSSLLDQAEDGETRSRLTRLLMTPAARGTDEMIAMAQDCVKQIRRGRYEKRLKEIEARLTNGTGEADQLALIEEYQAITGRLKQMG